MQKTAPREPNWGHKELASCGPNQWLEAIARKRVGSRPPAVVQRTPRPPAAVLLMGLGPTKGELGGEGKSSSENLGCL